MRYLVDFKNTATSEQIQQYLSENNCSVVQVWNNFEKVYLIESENIPPSVEIIENILSDDSVIIEPLSLGNIDINTSHFCLNDPNLPPIVINTQDQKDWWKNYTLKSPEFENPTKEISRKGFKVPVYIMDSGIKADHPEFSESVIQNIYSVTPGDFNDTNGHGTAIASIIAGKTCGLTSSIIKVVKIFSAGHNTLQSELLNALDAIISDVPELTFAVVNCSWIIDRNPWIEQKMLSAINRGIYFVTAAGNNGGTIENVTPAAMPEVLTVGSYGPDLVPSNFSNFTDESHISYTASNVNGGELDGWAPGENIYSATLNGGYGFASGTSMSAAITTAVLAYNLHDLTYSDGTRLVGYENSVVNSVIAENNLSWLCLYRADLLDLSDQKYINSRNRLASLQDAAEVDHTSNRGFPERLWGIQAGETMFGPRLFYSNEVKQAELLEPLPNNFYINPNGSMVGKPTLDQAPGDGDLYRFHFTKIRVTYTDDTTEEITVKIYIVSPSFTPDELPADHELTITLTRAGSCSNNFAQKFCEVAGEPFTTCADFCATFGGCCFYNFGKQTECLCT